MVKRFMNAGTRAAGVTIRDVAREAGVAVGTVSRVLNKHTDVNEDLRRRVLKAARDLKYRPSARARSLATNSSALLCFILSNREFLHPFHSHILQGVQDYCEQAEYFVTYTRFRYSPEIKSADLRLPPILQRDGMADCVLLAGTNYESFTKVLDDAGISYVLLANNFIGKRREAVDQVRFDDWTGAYEATRYLIQLGHKHIWYIGDISLPWYRARYEAYIRAMKEAGLGPLAQTLGLSEEQYAHGLKSVEAILEQKGRVTAIFAGTDEVAYGAWEGLRRHGLKVPQDVSLIGFDDYHSQSHARALTSVRVDAEQIGRELAKMAINKIASHGVPVPEVVVPTKLIKRETCRPVLGAPPGKRGG